MIISQNCSIKEEILQDKTIDEQIDDQNIQIPLSSNQKVHNDQHIFYCLKTAANQNYDQSIFNVSMHSSDTRQSRLRIKMKSKHDFRNSINLKEPVTSKSPESQKKNDSNFRRSVLFQRANKKIDLKLSEESPHIGGIEGSKNKILWTHESSEEMSKIKIKSEAKKRNYFNVKQFMELESKRKTEKAITMKKSESNSLIKRKKTRGLSSQKLKQFQFNAIDVTKNIVQKSCDRYGLNNRIRNEGKFGLLRHNKSYNEGLNGQKKELISAPTRSYFDQKLVEGTYELRGSLWRSNSYQLPRAKKPISTSMNGIQFLRSQQKESTYVRNSQNDNNIELNPWGMNQQMNISSTRNRYSGYKTQHKNNQEENEFLNYYIKKTQLKLDKQ